MRIITTLYVLLGLGLSLSAQSAYTPVFTLANPVENGSHFQFDVMLQHVEAGYFHTRGQIYLHYDPSVFGVSLAEQIVVEKLNLLDEQSHGNDKYSIINITNNQANILAITWAANSLYQDTSMAVLTEVPIIAMPLMRITFPRRTPASLDALQFAEDLMVDQQMYVRDEMVSTTNEFAFTDEDRVKVWPNPVGVGPLYVSTTLASLEADQPLRFILRDAQGRVVIEQLLNASSLHTSATVNVQRLQNGMYFWEAWMSPLSFSQSGKPPQEARLAKGQQAFRIGQGKVVKVE